MCTQSKTDRRQQKYLKIGQTQRPYIRSEWSTEVTSFQGQLQEIGAVESVTAVILMYKTNSKIPAYVNMVDLMSVSTVGFPQLRPA